MVTLAGLFITLEGIDGCGKTTQARLLADWLGGKGYTAVLTREPGGTESGGILRELLLSPRRTVGPEAELFLYLADRALHVREVVRPALEQGRVVVCERHADSTVAYQGYGRGLELALLRRLNGLATLGIIPDLTAVLDVPPDRARLDATCLDRLESQGQDFLARVAEGFRRLARDEPDRVKLVDGLGDVRAVHQQVVALVERLLEAKPPSGGLPREGP